MRCLGPRASTSRSTRRSTRRSDPDARRRAPIGVRRGGRARRRRMGARPGRARLPEPDPLPARLRGALPGLRQGPERRAARHEEASVDPRWAALEALRDPATDPAGSCRLRYNRRPLMAVPKRKTSKSRRDKRRAQHGDLGAARLDVRALRRRRSSRTTSARRARRIAAARSSRSARPPRRRSVPIARRGRRPRRATTRPTRSSPARSRRPRTTIEPSSSGPRRSTARGSSSSVQRGDRDGRQARRGGAREAGLVARPGRARGRRRRR